MGDVEGHRHTLLNPVDDDPAILDHSIRPAEVLQSGHDGNAGCISKVSIVVDYMHISTDAPTAHTFDDAERLGIESVGVTNDAVKGVGGRCLEIIGAAEVIVRDSHIL